MMRRAVATGMVLAALASGCGGGSDRPGGRPADLSGGEAFTASSLEQLKAVITSLQQQIGYETIKGDASMGWLR